MRKILPRTFPPLVDPPPFPKHSLLILPSPMGLSPAPSPQPNVLRMEKKKRRHKQLQTAVLVTAIALVLFIISFHGNLSRILLTGSGSTTTTVYNFHSQYHHYAVIEQHNHPGGSSLPIRATTDNFPVAAEGVLFPEWQVLLLLPHDDHPPSPSDGLFCLFRNGATSPANSSGILPSVRRAIYRCTLPFSVRRLGTFDVPRLVPSSSSSSTKAPLRELLRWNFIVYESLTTDDDVIVFAKGVNQRQGVDRPAQGLRCVFSVPSAGVADVRTTVTSSCQEVFRCLHPDDAHLRPLLAASARGGESVRISLEIRGGGPNASQGKKAVPSLAEYRPRAAPAPARGTGPQRGRPLLCACTMVYNVAKFLREWVVYHSRVGVYRFILYDNGSEDGLDRVVAGLRRRGYDVSSLLWLWPKTQEAAFSHCAAASLDYCEWMMFLDVDEFAFSPSWSNSSYPSPDMLRSILVPRPSHADSGIATTADGRPRLPVGQVSMGCHEFGPSNRSAHPANGVTQGYTCRRLGEERHKSIVRLEAVDPSLHNVVHHFTLREGYRWRKVAPKRSHGLVVNHYKYQAWEEFKAKFRRRASAFVVDWTQALNPSSKDRTPGLGFAAVEPPGWASQFCEVNDTRLRDVVRTWFGRGWNGSTGEYRMEWEDAMIG